MATRVRTARSPFGRVATLVDEEDRLLVVLDNHLGRAGGRSWRAGPGGHSRSSRAIRWIAGSAEGAARALSGRERLWGVTGCIMGMPESGSLEIPPEGGAVRLFAGGAGAAASVM
jgi:hypothetical protein